MYLKNIIVVVFVLLFTFQLSAQDLYRPSELQAFANIYMEQANKGNTTNEEVSSILETYQVSASEYRGIYLSESKNELHTLSANNQACLKEIKALKSKVAEIEKQQTEQLILESELSVEEYYAILKRYKNDRMFKQEVRVYFDK